MQSKKSWLSIVKGSVSPSKKVQLSTLKGDFHNKSVLHLVKKSATHHFRRWCPFDKKKFPVIYLEVKLHPYSTLLTQKDAYLFGKLMLEIFFYLLPSVVWKKK